MAQKYADKIIDNIKTTWITTDASINNKINKGGFGIIAINKNKDIIYQNKHRIDTNDAQFGEILGINNALESIIQKKKIISDKKIAIICDCKNAIKIITNYIKCPYKYKNTIQTINENIYIINNILNIQINFHWIPGHTYNPYNDLVDTLAKEAANSWPLSHLLFPQQLLSPSELSLLDYS